MPTRSSAPIIAAVLLLLLVLYLGSYLALVVPPNPFAAGSHRMRMRANSYRYRYFDAVGQWFFWPVKEIDKRLRPELTWHDMR